MTDVYKNLLTKINRVSNKKKTMNNKIGLTCFFYILIVLLASNNCTGQNKTVMILDYDMNLDFQIYSEYKARLVFNNKASLFTYKSKQLLDQESKDDFGNLSIVISDPVKYAVYTEQESKKIYEIQSNVNNYGKVDVDSRVEWEYVKDTTKTIANFKCNLAIAKVKGRLYYAWYTLEIPSKVGPWKLHGLPGLILQAHDSNNKVSFNITKISRSKEKIPSIFIDKYKWVSRKEFDKIQLKKLEELMKRISVKGSRKDKVTYEVNLGEQIEIK
jgi:GLPGLI family protein